MAETKRRLFLTFEQKMKIIKYNDEHRNITLQGLGLWAYKSLRLTSTPSKQALSRLLRNGIDDRMVVERPKYKVQRRVTSERLENDLLEWLRDCEYYGVCVTHDAIKQYSSKIYLSYGESETLSFSNGWLRCFLERHRMKKHGIHGESSSVEESIVREGMEKLQQLTELYESCDIYNLDETAYFFCKESTTSISKRSLKGRKDKKNRLTLVAAVNSDGTDKRRLQIIGHAQRPRWLGRRNWFDLGVDYNGSAKGWMTSTIFFEWVSKFNDEMAGQDRKVLLLVDNAPSHKVVSEFSNVDVCFLPPNTTAFLQPLDAGIIAALKAMIKKRKVEHVLTKFDVLRRHHKTLGTTPSRKEVADIHVVDMETAVRWAKEAWDALSMSTLSNCWNHTRIVGTRMSDLTSLFQALHLESLSIHFLTH
ncbi:Aste57867_1471 [Aphanomyces stellatus]|uniref:Aste57867_1471 protein n=1 Tax=Aphanomyces stellatus TaxID=120398 RepID=A0A485K6J0_9STRA|nr:hypothetical protein As57867_001470 [Aphanomyces stellatus]VFT78687.1 Aste57867_1471 [Aphanomyces stellatus]